jgi:hypothetical protein
MNKRLKIACILLYVFAIGTLLFGLLYLFKPTIMPYHEKFLGMTHQQLEPKVAFLFLGLMKVIGGLELALGVGLVMLVKGRFSKGDNLIWWTILVMCAVGLIPSLYVTLSIGLYTPWWGVAIMMILVAVALIISKPAMEKGSS